MECQKRIIISIEIENNILDIELASNTKISEIKKDLKSIVDMYNKKENKDLNVSLNNSKIVFNDEILDDDFELYKYGIWDGSLLKVEV